MFRIKLSSLTNTRSRKTVLVPQSYAGSVHITPERACNRALGLCAFLIHKLNPQEEDRLMFTDH